MRTVIAVLFVLSCTAYSQVPRSISYQGILSDEQGNLVSDGNHQLVLRLFDAATDGNQLFAETHTVAVVNGLFNAIIGSVNPLLASLAFDRAYFLAVSVDGGGEIAPRTPLTSAFTTGVTMAAGVSGWTHICDRNLKEHIAGVDGEKLLAGLRQLPISEWSYRNADPGVRYIGPMAQDFHAAFHLGGSDSLGIHSIIADGVNMAAAKALEKRTRELQAKIRVQEKTIETLYGILESVNRRLAHLERDVRDAMNSETEPISSTEHKSPTMSPASEATAANSASATVGASESAATAAPASSKKAAAGKRR